MINKNLIFLMISLAFSFISCTNDDDSNNPIIPLGDYENGLLVLHEGNFGQGNASVSYVSDDFMTIENSIFENINSTPLGDTAQSIAFNGDFAYIVLNVSNTIEVVNRYTFESVATISSGLNNPRFIAFSNGKGYVTNWGDGTVPTDDYIAIFNVSDHTMSSLTISVGEGPEEILPIGNSLYVAHQGGFGQNNIISIIEATSNTLFSTITVGDVPNSLQVDAFGDLWVLCGGKPAWTGDETAGQLIRINTLDNSQTTYDFATTEHPNYLTVDNGNVYYYLSGSVYSMVNTATSLPTNADIDGLNFYGMTVRNGTLYGVDAEDFASNGTLSVYDLSSGMMTNSTELGIIPSKIYFN